MKITCYATTVEVNIGEGPNNRKASRLERLALASEAIAKEIKRLAKPKEVLALAKELKAK